VDASSCMHQAMSLSPSTSVSTSEVPHKKRRTSSATSAPGNGILNGVQQQDAQSPNAQPKGDTAAHVPKRGARACTACRRGKNRCEGEVIIPFLPT
jgi:hypothetical protein